MEQGGVVLLCGWGEMKASMALMICASVNRSPFLQASEGGDILSGAFISPGHGHTRDTNAQLTPRQPTGGPAHRSLVPEEGPGWPQPLRRDELILAVLLRAVGADKK